MLRTYKVKHNLEEGMIREILQASQRCANFVAQESLKAKKLGKLVKLTSKHVKHFELHSHISNSIIKKYANNKKLKKLTLNKVKASFFLDNKKFSKETNILKLQPIKSQVKIWFPTDDIIKWNYAELDKTYAYITVTLKDVPIAESANTIGIDLNATSHSIVVASPKSGKVLKLGREISHLKKKYKNIRKRFQKKNNKRQLKKLENREHRKTVDIINKSVKRIVEFAVKEKASIKMEDLKGIRKRCTKKYCSELNHTINSWPFFMVRAKLTNKALQYGIKIEFIDPRFTSQKCSRCGHVAKENRNGKQFKCEKCSHFDHADVNAAFNIATAMPAEINSLAVKKKTGRTPTKRPRKSKTSNAVSSMVNGDGLSGIPEQNLKLP